MKRDVHVVGLCGSLGDDSGTRIAVQNALDAAEAAGSETTFVDLRTYDLPTFDSDDTDAGDAESIRRIVGDADAILLGTPMYHGSYSSPLKTALDYCGTDEFEGKTVGLLAVSGGSFPTSALDHLRRVCRAVHAWTLPLEVAIPASSNMFEDGEIANDQIAERVQKLGEQLTQYAGVDRYPEVASETAMVTDTPGN